MSGALDPVAARILSRWPVAVLSTFGTDRIDSVPVVFVLHDGSLYSPIDGKPKSGRLLARVRDLARDSRFTLLLQHYDEDWQHLWWLRLSGVGVVTEGEAASGPVAAALRAKYPQYDQFDIAATTGQLLRLNIESSSAWAFQGPAWLDAEFP